MRQVPPAESVATSAQQHVVAYRAAPVRLIELCSGATEGSLVCRCVGSYLVSKGLKRGLLLQMSVSAEGSGQTAVKRGVLAV